jgi:competence protein ComEA
MVRFMWLKYDPCRGRVFAVLVVVIWVSLAGWSWGQGGWESFPGARLVPSPGADGDSFVVEFVREGVPEQRVVRLYFVDAPESSASADADRRRVVEQMRYFGVGSAAEVLEAGQRAHDFAQELLAEPFTVHTAFATAPGRSATPRIYVLIETADGRDLGSELVVAGWARARGMARALADGTPGAEHAAAMSDLEAGAMLGRRGLWARADADRLAGLRAEERAEARTLREVFGGSEITGHPVDLNKATAVELQTLPGIGPALAERIMESRPYTTVEELTEIRGISVELLERVRDKITVE